MAVTVNELAVHIRAAADATDVPAEIATVLAPMKAWGDLAIQRAAPNAPDAYKDMALIQVVGYTFDRPASPRGDMHANALRNSGASSILKPFLNRRATILDDASPIAVAQDAVSFQVEDSPTGHGHVLVLRTADGTEYRFPQLEFVM